MISLGYVSYEAYSVKVEILESGAMNCYRTSFQFGRLFHTAHHPFICFCTLNGFNLVHTQSVSLHTHLSFIDLLQVYTCTTHPMQHRGSPAQHTVEIPYAVDHMSIEMSAGSQLTSTRSTLLVTGIFNGFHLITR